MEPMKLTYAVLVYDTLEDRWRYDALWTRADNLMGEHRASGWLTKAIGPTEHGETEARMLAARFSGASPDDWVVYSDGKPRLEKE